MELGPIRFGPNPLFSRDQLVFDLFFSRDQLTLIGSVKGGGAINSISPVTNLSRQAHKTGKIRFCQSENLATKAKWIFKTGLNFLK